MLPKQNLTKHDSSNECYTPAGTIKYLLPFIPKHVKSIWCPCDKQESNIVIELQEAGFDVIYSHIDDGFDFLNYEPIHEFYDMIITNPPFNIKTKILQRAYELGKPFILYLPLTALEGIARHKLYKEYGLNVGILANRINFIINGKQTDKSWFNTSFFMGNMETKNQLYFIDNSINTQKTRLVQNLHKS